MQLCVAPKFQKHMCSRDWNPWSQYGVVFIIDHEIISCSLIIYDEPSNSSWDHFNVHQGKIVNLTMELKVSKRHVFKPTLSIVTVQRIVQRERQKRFCHCKSLGDHDKQMPFSILFLLNLYFFPFVYPLQM